MNGSAEPLHGFRAGLTIGQAASTLGVSPSTVRRWVRSGRLRSDQVAVGDSFEYRIPLEALEGFTNPCTDPSAVAVVNGSTDASVPAGVEPSTERSAALAAYNAQLIAPLTAVIEQQATTIDRQAEQLVGKEQEIGAIREERGRLTAELERAASTVVALNDQLAAAESVRRRTERRLSVALAMAVTQAIAAGLAPGWVR